MCKDFRGIQKTALKDQLTHIKRNDSRKMSQKKKKIKQPADKVENRQQSIKR